MNAAGDGSPRERQRLRKLAQAAMNADQTVDQMEAILAGLGPVLEGMGGTIDRLDGTISNMDSTLVQMTKSLESVDRTVARMDEVVTRLERITDRVEQVVGLAEAAMRPLGAIESAGRGVVGMLGFGGHGK